MKQTFKISLNKISLVIALVGLLLEAERVSSEEALLSRSKRGASVYPVFGGGSNHGATFLQDPSPFAQYVGGGGSSGSSHGTSSYSPAPHQSISTFYYAHSPQSSYSSSSSYGGSTPSHTSTVFDTNHLNTYAQSSHGSSNSYGSSSSPSPSSGWSPNGSLGYGGSYYTPSYGHVTANFAHAPSQPATPRNSHGHSPTLSAHSLAQSAHTSYHAQNNLYNVLLAGSHRPTYKGSSYRK